MLDDLSQWPVPTGCQVVPTDTGNIGDTWNGTSFISPVVLPSTLPPIPAAQLVAMEITDRSLLRALILALNDGSFVPGSNLPNGQLRAVFNSKL